MRQTIRELDQEAWAYRKDDRRPLHHGFIRQARRHPLRLAFADLQTPQVSLPQSAGRLDRASRGRLRPRWDGPAERRRSCCRPASGGALANLAASLAGKTVVNLNFTTGRAGMESAAAQAGLQDGRHQPRVPRKGKIEPPAAESS